MYCRGRYISPHTKNYNPYASKTDKLRSWHWVTQRDDVEALAMWREEMTQEPGNPTGSNQYQEKESGISNNVTISTPDRGNSRSYTVARLKQHNPELFEKVVSGELHQIG